MFLNHRQAVPGGRRRHTMLRSRHAKGLFARTLHQRAGRNAPEGVRARRGEGGDQVCLRDAHGRGQDGVKIQVFGSFSCHNGKDSPKISSSRICYLLSGQWWFTIKRVTDAIYSFQLYCDLLNYWNHTTVPLFKRTIQIPKCIVGRPHNTRHENIKNRIKSVTIFCWHYILLYVDFVPLNAEYCGLS